ncbi:transglutaminase family protein [Ktedonosporobacter rubrisoli]|nr:transglutaminase family protein [Ktedonosporobacter rubrisoli]
MKKKSIFLVLILLVLTILSSFYVVGGTQAYSHYQQSILEDQQHCGGQAPVRICVRAPTAIFSAFYPSYVSTQYPLFTIDYSSSEPLTLILSVTVTHFSQTQTHTVNATTGTQSSTFIPAQLEQALAKLTLETNTALHVEVKDTRGHSYYVDDIALLLHSRWLMQWTTLNRLKIAAWVTPGAPSIAKLVTKATAHLKDQEAPVPAAMVGYNGATPQQVMDQVDAIYDTLWKDYHIHYIQASVPYSATALPADNTAMQTVKLPAEVLQQHSGMCIELTALLAAAVERIGLHAEIVIIPGHAFLGVALTSDNKQFQYWDAVDVNNNVAADSAMTAANNLYSQNEKQHTIIDTILISDARNTHIGPMF